MPGDWVRVKGDVVWSIRDGNPDPEGRRMMDHAARQGSLSWMGEYKDGFYRTQSGAGVKANFDACARENQGRLYNLGREALGLPRVRSRATPVKGAKAKARPKLKTRAKPKAKTKAKPKSKKPATK